MKVVSKPKGRTQGTRKVVQRPRLAVVQLAEAQPDYEPELPDVSPEELPMEDRIRAAFGQVGEADHITVHLYRLTQNNKPEEYLFACGPDDLDNIMDRVRDACGSGTYRVRVYKNRRIATQFDFSVYVPPKPIAPVAPVQSESTALVQVLERMMERLSTPAPQGDRFDDAVKLIGVLKVLQPAAAPTPAFDASSMLTLLRSGFELFREMVPAAGGGDDDSVVGLVREGLKMLPSILPMMQPQSALPSPAAQSETTMPDLPPQPEQPQPASTGNPLLDALRQPLAYLVTRAIRRAPVEAAAEWTFNTLALEGVPEEVMAGLLERPDLLQVLMQLNPNVQQHGPWFSALIDAMRGMIFEPETENQNANVPGDSAADPKSAAT